MKCPVCEKEIDGRKKQCNNCGFSEFRKEFINQNEYEAWLKETVEPCRSIYKYLCIKTEFEVATKLVLELRNNEIKKLKQKYDELQEEYDQLDSEHDELQEEYDQLDSEYDELNEEYEQLQRDYDDLEKTKSISNKYEPKKKDGWNYTDLVSHPNYAKCSYVGHVSVFEIYNINGVGNSSSYKIQFMLKLLTTNSGKSERVHFQWRVKDKDGIVVLTGNWIKDGLLIGDIVRGEIVLNNVGEHIYSIDFIDV